MTYTFLNLLIDDYQCIDRGARRAPGMALGPSQPMALFLYFDCYYMDAMRCDADDGAVFVGLRSTSAMREGHDELVVITNIQRDATMSTLALHARSIDDGNGIASPVAVSFCPMHA